MPAYSTWSRVTGQVGPSTWWPGRQVEPGCPGWSVSVGMVSAPSSGPGGQHPALLRAAPTGVHTHCLAPDQLGQGHGWTWGSCRIGQERCPSPRAGCALPGASPQPYPLPGQLGPGLLGQQWVPRQSWQVCPRPGPMWPRCLLFRTLLLGDT